MDKTLCGAGVAFKLVQALVPVLGLSPHLPLHFLDYVALASHLADIPDSANTLLRLFEGSRSLGAVLQTVTSDPVVALKEALRLQGDSTVRVPDGPGLGIELDRSAIDKYRVG